MALTVAGQPAQVADVSSSGLRVACKLDAAIGDTVTIDFAGFDSIEGRLIWIRGGDAGLSLPTGSLELEE
jgi:hypothetical protein